MNSVYCIKDAAKNRGMFDSVGIYVPTEVIIKLL